jgi:hypothetical protein
MVCGICEVEYELSNHCIIIITTVVHQIAGRYEITCPGKTKQNPTLERFGRNSK